MAYEMKDGQGTMFQNSYKEAGDSKPDLRGECVVNGEVLEIAGWWKNPNPEKGQFLSLKIQPKQQRQNQTSGGDGQSNQNPPQGGRGTPPPPSRGRPGQAPPTRSGPLPRPTASPAPSDTSYKNADAAWNAVAKFNDQAGDARLTPEKLAAAWSDAYAKHAPGVEESKVTPAQWGAIVEEVSGIPF